MKTPYLVDRQPQDVKIKIWVPARSPVDEDAIREVTGKGTHVQPAGSVPGFRRYAVSCHYRQAIVAWLRSLPGSGGVRLRNYYHALRHCSPQCEGAWVQAERGEYHDDHCNCSCGGYRHNSGNPWWARFDVVDTGRDGEYISEVRFLPPLSEVEH